METVKPECNGTVAGCVKNTGKKVIYTRLENRQAHFNFSKLTEWTEKHIFNYPQVDNSIG